MMGIETIIAWCVLSVAVGLGSRHAGRMYGLIFGMLCSALWAVFAVSLVSANIPVGPMTVFVTGGLLLILVGLWSGSSDNHDRRSGALKKVGQPTPVQPVFTPGRLEARLALLSKLPDQFAEWLEQFRHHVDPWPAFEYHIRTVLREVCSASDVNAYRVLDDGDLMVPLSEVGPHKLKDCVRAGQGVPGWVIKTAQPYYTFMENHDEDLQLRVARSRLPLRWCFPIVRGGHVIGVVTVRSWDIGGRRDINLLKLLSGVISEQWGCLTEMCRARVALMTDNASGLLTRAQFLRQAPLVLEKSYRQSKPVSAATFSLDGLRQLDDKGYWGLRDLAVASVGRALRKRVTPKDCVSHFDDSRFVVVWHGADAERAQEDMSEIISELEKAFEDQAKWRREIRIRCGLASSRSRQKTLHILVSEAFQQQDQPEPNREQPAPAFTG